ncbi:MAG: ABC transporter ATP-binding protein [Candidatus Wallbacteria bacterium]|nr:ABC transporter ATP-binding protein [Candidatus Wallbacteria bacterium]
MIFQTEQSLKKPFSYYFGWVWKNYLPHLPMVLMMMFLTVLSTTVSVLYPRLSKYIIDKMTVNLGLYSQGKIAMPDILAERDKTICLILILGLGLIISQVYPYFRAKMNFFFETLFRERYFKVLLEKNYRFFLRYRTGDIVTRLTDDIKCWPPGIAWFICSGIFRGFNSSCTIFFCFVSMLLLNVKLAILSASTLPFMFLFFVKLRQKIEVLSKKNQEAISQTNDFLESAYSGIKIVKSFNAEATQTRGFKELLEKRMGMEMKLVRMDGLFSVYFEFINYLGQVVVLLLGGMMAIRGEITIGDYYAFYTYLGMIIWPLLDLPRMFVTASQSFVAIDRLEEMEEFEADHPDYQSGDQKTGGIETLEFRNISFTYPARIQENTDETQPKPEIKSKPGFGMKQISFTLQKGEKVAIVGKIGSGKTTILNLVSGFLLQDSGSILINSVPLTSLDKEAFRQKIGYVQQEPNIFSESVKTNIDFWRDYGEDWISHCAKTAQLEEDIKKFPAGYAEKIGQRGITLSGGQRQRISIARALAGKPELFLMDDVTSSLDAENEQNFWQEVEGEFPGITSLIVTHRLSTAQKADRIIVLADGRIEAIGTHAELIDKSATYRELISK